MRYFISLLCSNRECKNRSVKRVLESISSSAAKETVNHLNSVENSNRCPICQNELIYYLDFQPDDYELEHEQSLLS